MHQFEVAVPVSYRTVHTVVSLKFVLMYNCTNFVKITLHYFDKLRFFHDLQNTVKVLTMGRTKLYILYIPV